MNTPFSYVIKSPSVMEPGRKYPAIFIMHGIGYNEERMMAYYEELKDNFILISIRGHLPHEQGYCYYRLRGYGNPIREEFDGAIQLLKNFIDQAIEEYPIDRDKIYLTGFSQGAILSNSFALILGDRLKGIAALNGYVPSFLKEEHPAPALAHLSVLITQGEKDQVFAPEIGQQTYDYFKERARSVKYVIYPDGHEISVNMQQDLVAWFNHDVTK